MAFVDEIVVHARAGHGGNGVVRWRHIKGKDLAGPSGGNGGRGGNIYVRGSRDLGLLQRYRNVKEFAAAVGGDGEKDSCHGKDGEDLYIDVPIGSFIKNLESGYEVEVTKDGESHLLLHGGRGGVGNEFFKSSINRSPKEARPGEPGDEADLTIELRLIADAGFIGLPNAGKSSLLNALTNAKAKIGSYQFTTLEPNLGELYGIILADIPGLIEGASSGKGLGHKFLRHIRRTKMLLHCVSLEEDFMSVYSVVRAELAAYDPALAEKPEAIILTKTDTVSAEKLKEVLVEAKKCSRYVFAVSILDDSSLKKLREDLTELLKNL